MGDGKEIMVVPKKNGGGCQINKVEAILGNMQLNNVKHA
jgi:hypothetical protein